MTSANAWLLDLGDAMHAAIGIRELVQIIEAPATFSVPLTPAHSRNIMFWQKRMVPVFDLSIRLDNKASKGTLMAIVGYHDATNQTAGLGAIILAAPPVRIAVDDAQACTLDEDMARWHELANSSFKQEGEVIPVLHLSRLFGAAD
jgi:chemotaxis signal transduction protein